jgi:hypothetical protein
MAAGQWKKDITGGWKRKNCYSFILNSYENKHWFVKKKDDV